MDTALGWIGEFVHWLVRFFPSMIIVKTTHAGVKYKWGKVVVPLGPGIHFYWPLVTEVLFYPTARQTVNMPAQALTTTDGTTILVSGVVVYKINDIEAALNRNYDIEDTIADISQTALADKVAEFTLKDFMADLTGVKKALTAHAKKELSKYGVHVFYFGLVEVAKCQVLRTTGPAYLVNRDEE